MHDRVSDAFQATFHSKPVTVARAPGRVNLIGEHTDYNEGYVLPMAIDRAVWIALRPRTDRLVRVHALDMEQLAEFDLDALTKGEARWTDYMKGVAAELLAEGFKLQGWEGVMSGNVPRGAGLSSSAALEVVTARAFAVVSGIQWDALRMARLAQRAENNWVGVRSGIMDQAVSAAARAGHAFFLDCRSLEYEHIPMPGKMSVVIMDTSTRRGLVDSAYNERHAQCDAAARAFNVRSLRDVGPDQFARQQGKLDRTTMRRARHVVTENARVLDAVRAMRAEDAAGLGRLFNESHASLRDDFQVTGEALDMMVEIARSHPGCYGARMTGAGFGGCAVAVVQREQAETFANEVGVEYQRRTGREPEIFICEAGGGASIQ